MASKQVGVNKDTHGTTSSSFRSGHPKGKGLPAKPTKTKRAGHRI